MSTERINRLVSLFPDGITPPSEGDVKLMLGIDERIQGTREELTAALESLKGEQLGRLCFNQGSPSGLEYDNWYSPYASVPTLSGEDFEKPDQLKAEHERRSALIKGALHKHPDVTFEDGGLKSVPRIREKLIRRQKAGKLPKIPDLSRVRLICDGLGNLDACHYDIESALFDTDDMHYQGHLNTYGFATSTEHAPYLFYRTFWAANAEKGDVVDDVKSIATEIQYVTRRVRAVSGLNHPFDVSKRVPYPDDEYRDWLHRLLLKASVLDFQELAAQESTPLEKR